MVLVVGNPRQHTSAVMQSLERMGLRVIGDFTPSEINARGNGECQESHNGVDTSKYGPQDAMKVFIGPLLWKSRVQPTDKIIYCLRSPAGVAASQGKAHIWNPVSDLRRFNYWRLVTQFRDWMLTAENPVLVVDTDAMIADPGPWMAAIGEFVGAANVAAAVANIDPTLTRDPPEEIEDAALTIYREMKRCTAII